MKPIVKMSVQETYDLKIKCFFFVFFYTIAKSKLSNSQKAINRESPGSNAAQNLFSIPIIIIVTWGLYFIP
jgi:hypothetical protein